MNENAVSSDPVFAFLLDEVVVKDWCKETFKNIVSDLCEICILKYFKFCLVLSLFENIYFHFKWEL